MAVRGGINDCSPSWGKLGGIEFIYLRSEGLEVQRENSKTVIINADV